MKLDPETVRVLSMSEAELRADMKARGLDWDTEIARVNRIFEQAKEAAEIYRAFKPS